MYGIRRGLTQALQRMEQMRGEQGHTVEQQEAALSAMFARDAAVDDESTKEMASLRQAQVSTESTVWCGHDHIHDDCGTVVGHTRAARWITGKSLVVLT